MTISILQSATNSAQFADGSHASVSVTLPGVTSGSSIAVFITCDWGATASCADPAAYTQRQLLTDNDNQQRTYLFTLDGASAGSHAITAAFSPPTKWDAIQAFEIGGTAGYYDSASQLQPAPGFATDAISSTSITPISSGSLLLGFSQNVGGVPTPSAGTGFTDLGDDGTIRARAEYLVQGSPSSQPATFTATANLSHVSFVAAFGPIVTGQFARPSSDVSAGIWTPSTGTSLAGTIDETPFSDTDYDSATANGTFRVNLSAVSTPDTGTRTVRFRAGGSSAKKLIATLIEGAGTTVASTTIDPLPAAVTTQSFTVSGAIGNYADLDLSFEVANATTTPTPSVTFGAIGTGANGGASVAPTYPASITSGDLLVLTVTSGGATSPTPGTPSGWTSQGSYVTTDGTYGIDTGPRRVTVFTKPADGTETGTLSVTITGGDSCRGSIMRLSKGQASYVWDIAATGGNYSANGTAVSVTGGAIGFAPGDLVIVSNGQRVDTATQSAQALTASGITFGTLTNRASVAVTTGNDHCHVIDSRPVSTGTASVAPTWSYTASAACSAAIHILRIREVPPTEFARVTFAEFEVPAAAGGAGAVFADTDQRWSLLAAVQADADIRWALLNSSQADADMRWSLLSAVQIDTDQRWSMLAAVQTDADLQWQTLSAILNAQADLDARWSLLTAAQTDADIRWSGLSAAQSDADIRWALLGAAQSDIDARWVVIAAVQSDAEARWSILAAAQSDADLRWSLLKSAQADLDARWALLASAHGDTDLRWQILSAVLTAQADLDARWALLSATQSDADLRWSVLAALQADADARWAVLASATVSADARWAVLAPAEAANDLRWQVDGATLADLALQWSVGALAVLAASRGPSSSPPQRVAQTSPARPRAIQTATRTH